MNNRQAKTSGLAIASLIMAILCAPVGIILGIVALSQISKSNGALKGQGLAIAGIVLAGFWFVLGMLSAIAIPNFIRYQLRAKTSEAKTNLMAIKTSQEVFRAEYEAYASAKANGGGGNMKAPWEEETCS